LILLRIIKIEATFFAMAAEQTPVGCPDREAIAKGLKDHYFTLAAGGYFDESRIQVPPPTGWNDNELDIEALRVLKRSDRVIDLLRHIPYIKPWSPPNKPDVVVQWPVFEDARAVRYLRDEGDFAAWFGRVGVEEGGPKPEDFAPQHYRGESTVWPDDIAVIARPCQHIPGRLPWILVNCETGLVGEMNAWNLHWQIDCETVAADFFANKTALMIWKNYLPVPPVNDFEPIIFTQQEKTKQAFRTLQGIYGFYGWTELQSDPTRFQESRSRHICKVNKFYIRWKEVQAEEQAREDAFDNADDEDYKTEDVKEDDDAASLSSSEGDPMDLTEDAPVETLHEEVDEVWADLEKEEYDLVKEQFKEDGIPLPPSPTVIPAKLDVPPLLEEAPRQLGKAEVSRNEIVRAFTKHLTLLSQMACIKPARIQLAPEGGWQTEAHEFPLQELQALGYSEKAIDLLQHLPQLAYDDGHECKIFPRATMVQYQPDSLVFGSRYDPKELSRRSLEELGLSPFQQPLPPDVVTLAFPGEDPGGRYVLVDADKGNLGNTIAHLTEKKYC